MRLLLPPKGMRAADLLAVVALTQTPSELVSAGWQAFLDAALASEAPDWVPASSVTHCQRCVQAEHERAEGLRASGLPPSRPARRRSGARPGLGRWLPLVGLSLLAGGRRIRRHQRAGT